MSTHRVAPPKLDLKVHRVSNADATVDTVAVSPMSMVKHASPETFDDCSASASPPSYHIEHAAPAPICVSKLRTIVLLGIFCFAEFVEISSGSSVIPILGDICQKLDIQPNDSQWVLSAYALSFAAFMLLAGRMSDIYSARYVFCIGFLWAGAFSLAAGFARTGILLYVLRAFQGLGAACSIPSAIRLIVLLTPDRKQQGQALQLFALAGGTAATLSSLIGGGIATSVRYEWVFWLVAIAAIPTSMIAFLLIPPSLDTKTASAQRWSHRQRLRQVDLLGALLVALFLILFVFALTEGNRVGWAQARVLVPLLIAVNLVLPFFLVWEEYGRTRRNLEACLPLSLWKTGNFAILFIATAASFYWYGAVYITFTTLWSQVYLYSPWQQAKYFLPIGIATMLQAGVTPIVVQLVGHKFFLTFSSLLAGGGGALLANADTAARYWRIVAPGQALIQTGSPAISGVLGAIWTSALQFGLVVAIAVCLALISAFDGPDLQAFRGYRAASYSMTIVGGVLALLILIFLKPEKLRHDDVTNDGEIEKEQSAVVPVELVQESLPASPNSVFKR